MAKESKDNTPAPQPATDDQAITASPENASPLFDASGSVAAANKTEGAAMPEVIPAPEKRGRGRPKGSANADKRSHKKKTPEAAEVENTASAQLIVGALDIVRKGISGGECPDSPELRGATVEAWAEYLRQNNWEVPAWVQVAVISSMYVAPAFSTPKGQGRIAGLWGKVKAWWVLRHAA